MNEYELSRLKILRKAAQEAPEGAYVSILASDVVLLTDLVIDDKEEEPQPSWS